MKERAFSDTIEKGYRGKEMLVAGENALFSEKSTLNAEKTLSSEKQRQKRKGEIRREKREREENSFLLKPE